MTNNYFIILALLFSTQTFCMQKVERPKRDNITRILRFQQEIGRRRDHYEVVNRTQEGRKIIDAHLGLPSYIKNLNGGNYFTYFKTIAARLLNENPMYFNFFVDELCNVFGKKEALEKLVMASLNNIPAIHYEGPRVNRAIFCKRLIQSYGLDINYITNGFCGDPDYQRSPLHAAAGNLDVAAVRFLLEINADKTIKNSDNQNPFECFTDGNELIEEEPHKTIAMLLQLDEENT